MYLAPDGVTTRLILALLAGLLVGWIGWRGAMIALVGLPALLAVVSRIGHPGAGVRAPVVACGRTGGDVGMPGSLPAGTEARANAWSDGVWLAQRRYGFDQPTAVRLVFMRWLYATGRLRHERGRVPQDAESKQLSGV
jgi:hypothetical protein